MSKLEVKEIGPISGETEVRLAEGATAVGFGGEGSIVQTVLGTCSVYMTSNSGDYVVTGLEATITPTKASSKILVIWNVQACSVDNGSFSPGLSRNGEVVYDTPNPIACYANGIIDLYRYEGPFIIIDEPKTTSACKYETLFKTQDGVIELNGKCSGGIHYPAETQILLQEIAG